MWPPVLLLVTTLAVFQTLTYAQSPEARCSRVSFAFFANEDDCGRFWFCNDGEAVDIECREDEIWRQMEGSCVLGNRDSCTVWNPADACIGMGNGPIEYPGYCERYINCVEERANVNYCPLGMIFSMEDQRCVIGSAFSCESFEGVCVDGPYNRFRHPDFCEMFIQCNNQTALLTTCGYMEIFAPDVKNCVAGESCVPTAVETVCVGRYDSWLAHPEDCGSFIMCEEGVFNVTTCPEGQIFRDQSCVPGSRATCQTFDGTCAIQTNGEQLEHPDSCGLYVECFGGLASIRSCPEERIFRPDMQFCIPGDPISCEATSKAEMCENLPYGIIFPHPDDCSQLIRCYGNEALEEPCPENHIVQPRSLTCVPGLIDTCQSFDEICQEKIDERIPHPRCDLFVYCLNEKASVLPCAPGEIFSAADNKCVPGDIEQCEALSCIERPDGIYPHPSLCHGFYQCTNEQISSHICPFGHIFNPTLRVCTPGNVETCTADPLETMCENKFDGDRYPYPDGSDCLQFVVCESRQAVVYSCQPGAVLRPQILDCVPGDETSCEVFEDICPENADGMLPHPSRCDVLIRCEAGVASVESCPEGQIVDPETLECVPGGIEDCFPVVNRCEGRDDGLYGEDGSCAGYIRCESGEMTVLTCPEGSVFEQELQSCVPGDVVTCTNICTEQESEVLLENPSSCAQYFRCSEGLPIAESCSAGNIFIGTDCVPGDSESCEDFSDRCIDQPDGNNPFPDQCGLFLECTDGITSVGTCQEETIFVAELGECLPGDAAACTNICSGRDDDTLILSMESCTNYFRCTGGIPILESCEPDHVFDESSGSCVPGNVDSCETFGERCVGQPDGLLPIPDSSRCNQFLACSAESVSLRSCPQGEIYSESAQLCVPGDSDTCITDEFNFCEGLEDGSYAHPQVCYLFVDCNEGVAQVEACGTNEIFIAESAGCEAGDRTSC